MSFVNFKFKNIISLFLLVSFLVIMFFGLVIMIHGSEGQMSDDCPLSAIGDTVCPQDIMSAGIHHLTAYYSFFNVPVNSIILTLVFSLLVLVLLALILEVGSSLFKPPKLTYYLASSSFFTLNSQKINHWLSILENSPSLY